MSLPLPTTPPGEISGSSVVREILAEQGDDETKELPDVARALRLWETWPLHPELAAILREVVLLWRDEGTAAIMERRAMSVGMMLGHVERLIGKDPARLPQLGPLYARLIEAERRAWSTAEELRKPKGVGGDADLARRASRSE